LLPNLIVDKKMKLPLSRIEVMKYVGEKIDQLVDEFLNPIDSNWQPSDFLPDATTDNFTQEIKELQASCKELPYDYMAVLVGDCVTEEALPTYSSWLMAVEGVNQAE
jgi:acyl-[acyl-carrier-protein] desaturase